MSIHETKNSLETGDYRKFLCYRVEAVAAALVSSKIEGYRVLRLNRLYIKHQKCECKCIWVHWQDFVVLMYLKTRNLWIEYLLSHICMLVFRVVWLAYFLTSEWLKSNHNLMGKTKESEENVGQSLHFRRSAPFKFRLLFVTSYSNQKKLETYKVTINWSNIQTLKNLKYKMMTFF